MYDTSAWKKLRMAKLSTQPLCQSCLQTGIVKGAEMVDHLFSWSILGKTATATQDLSPREKFAWANGIALSHGIVRHNIAVGDAISFLQISYK